MSTLEADRVLIQTLGGPAKVADMLDFRKEGGTQRVQNWLSRGIPPAIKLAHPHIFLRIAVAAPAPAIDAARTPAQLGTAEVQHG